MSTDPMKLVFFGTPQFAVPSLETLLSQAGFELLAVVTQPDKRRGRGNELSASPVKSTALAYRLPVWQPARIKKDAETLENLRQLGADAFVVVARSCRNIAELRRFNGVSIMAKLRRALPRCRWMPVWIRGQCC